MNFRELLENIKMVFRELVENKEMVFKKEAPNCHFILTSVIVPKKDADKLIKNTNHIKSGLLKFAVFDTEVIVGYNLWNELNLNKYPELL